MHKATEARRAIGRNKQNGVFNSSTIIKITASVFMFYQLKKLSTFVHGPSFIQGAFTYKDNIKLT